MFECFQFFLIPEFGDFDVVNRDIDPAERERNFKTVPAFKLKAFTVTDGGKNDRDPLCRGKAECSVLECLTWPAWSVRGNCDNAICSPVP